MKTKLQLLLLQLSAIALLSAAGACAQEAAGNLALTDQETIRTLVQQVKQLQDKVADLEAKQMSAPPPAAADAPPAPAGGDSPSLGMGQAATFEESHDVHGIRWRGFGEVNYKVLNQRQPDLGTFGFVPGSAGNFFTGDFDLFLTSQLTEKTSVLAELVVGEGDAQSFHTELARAIVKFDPNDYVRLAFGRYHTAISYYNRRFTADDGWKQPWTGHW